MAGEYAPFVRAECFRDDAGQERESQQEYSEPHEVSGCPKVISGHVDGRDGEGATIAMPNSV